MSDLARAGLVLSLLLSLGADGEAGVARIEIAQRLSYADGRAFGGVGPYQRLLGRVTFAVDPEAPTNRPIVDLGLAPRDERGLVRFAADLEILAPVDLRAASGALLYDVNNRGERKCLDLFNTGADHYLMRAGYIVVWSGWIAEVSPGGDRLTLEAPTARNGDRPITGWVRAEIVPGAPADRLNITNRAHHGSHAPTARGSAEATLTWRLREADPRVPIPRGQWCLETTWAEDQGRRGRLPEVELVLAGGFEPGYLYELIYEARDPVVQGLGLAGIRDLVSFLKNDTTDKNPLRRPDGTPAVRRTLGFGISQSGRCLRSFLHEGFNADEQGRRVFDGIMPHVAGAGLGSFNQRFASPTRHNDQHDDHLFPCDLFPFSYGDEQDPFTGRRDGLLRRARACDAVPKVMHVQTSAEYWHRGGSLVHTDPAGRRDAELPPEVRIYAIGGAQHGPGDGLPRPREAGQLPANPTDYRPILRALLAALDAWVRDGTEPPPSRYPRIAEGQLVGWREAESGWSALPGVRYPEVIHEPMLLDFGETFAGLGRNTRHPPLSRGHYRVLVPSYYPDDNERGMLLLPSVAVPLATYTGWNLRHRTVGAEGELLRLSGGTIPFARTAAERGARGDPRPAVQERYRDFEDYRTRTDAAARRLIRERYVLPEDLGSLLNLARTHESSFAP